MCMYVLRVILIFAVVLAAAGIHTAAADKGGGGVVAPPVTRPVGSPIYQAVARTKVFDFRDRIIGPEARRALDERRETWIELNDDFSSPELRVPIGCDANMADVVEMVLKSTGATDERERQSVSAKFQRAMIFRGRSIEQLVGRAGPCDSQQGPPEFKAVSVRPGDVVVVPVRYAAREAFEAF